MNSSQREAVYADVLAPLVLVALPGSGKTFCLIERLRFALQSGVQPSEVLMLTFTNKAAREMRERANMGSEVQLTTFHSFCLGLARQHGFVDRRATVWGDPETKKALRSLLAARVRRDDPNADVSAQTLGPLLAKAVALLNRPLRELAQGSDERALVEGYSRLKEAQGAVDFDDMISVVCQRLGKMSREASPLARYRVVMVDEWQDTSSSQLELVKLFGTRGITVVGDPHQSIYAFRGAEFGNWKKLCDLLKPKVVYLSTNYRSTSVVSAVCQGLIAYNPVPRLGDTPPQQVVQTVKPEKDPVTVVQCADSAGEAEFICETMRKLNREHGVEFGDMAILYRSNPRQTVSRLLEKHLIGQRVPYVLVAGQALYEAKVVKQVLSYLRLLLNRRDEMAFDVCAKHQKMSKKKFEPAWRAYRAAVCSTDALERFASERIPAPAALAPFREGLLKLARLLASWRQMLSSDVALKSFARSCVIEDAGFALEEQDTAEKIEFLVSQMEECKTKEVDGKEGPVSLEEQLIAFLEQVALFSPSERGGQAVGGRCVLSTIHQAKGLEWQAVFVIQCLEGVIPSRQSLKRTGDDEGASAATDDVEEERRLFFVAMSRAKRFLYLTHPNPATDGKRSRFLEETIVSVKPGKLVASKSAARRTDFSSASSLIRANSSEPELVKQIEFGVQAQDEPMHQAQDQEPPPPESKKAKIETPKVKDAFSVLMKRK